MSRRVGNAIFLIFLTMLILLAGSGVWRELRAAGAEPLRKTITMLVVDEKDKSWHCFVDETKPTAPPVINVEGTRMFVNFNGECTRITKYTKETKP